MSLFVSSTKILDVGSEVQIQVARASGDEPLALAGRVVRVEEGGNGKPIGMAVEFSELDAELSAEIDALIAAGVAVDLKCSDGLCGVCVCKVTAGEVEHRDFVLSKAQRAAGAMILCQSRAAEDGGALAIEI